MEFVIVVLPLEDGIGVGAGRFIGSCGGGVEAINIYVRE